MKLARRLNSFSEPQTIKMAKLGRELKAKGVNLIDLSLGEPDFPTPAHICDAATAAMNAGQTKYSPVAGLPELLEAISIKLKRDNNLEYAPNEIMVSTGAKQSLANAILCLTDPDDEVLIPTPFWVTYGALVQLAGGRNKFIHCGIETDFKVTPQQLEEAISPNSRLFIFSSPCNPTGSVYTRDELEGLVEVFRRHPQITIISDEIYEFINYSGRHESIAQFSDMKERVVVVNGMSKGFAMTGWRIGYMAGPRELVQACDKFQAQFTSGTNVIAQRASITALLSDLGPTRKMVEAYRERRDYVIGALQAMPGVKASMPGGAFYAFPDISSFFGKSYGQYTIQNDEDMAMYLLNEGHVSGVMGSAFGSPNCIRFSFATSMDNLREGMNRIANALAKLS